MEGRRSNEVSSAEAVLVGALSSGVNAPTWFLLKITFLLLALCFTAMFALAFSSKNFVIVAHVLLLVTIGTVLFVLLNRFLAEVGLVSVEQQMKEMGIHKTEATDKDERDNNNNNNIAFCPKQVGSDIISDDRRCIHFRHMKFQTVQFCTDDHTPLGILANGNPGSNLK